MDPVFLSTFQKGCIMDSSDFKSIVFHDGISVYTHHHHGKCIHGSTKWFQVYTVGFWKHFLIKTKMLDVSYYVDSTVLQNLLFGADMLTFAIIMLSGSMDPSQWFHDTLANPWIHSVFYVYLMYFMHGINKSFIYFRDSHLKSVK